MSFPNFTFWSHLLVTLGVEVCCLAALGYVAQRLSRSAIWQRAVWQMTVICLLLLPASEWTGFGRGAAQFLFGQRQTVTIAPARLTPFKSEVLSWPAAARAIPSLVRPQPAMWWPGWVWLTGAVVVLGRMATAQVLLLTLRLRREKIAGGALRERVDNIATCVGLRRKVNLLRMPQSISPMAFGLLRPSIGLPPGFEARYSAPEQDAVLAHELAHLAAKDPIWFSLSDFATALLWWHPLTWWVRRSLHLSAELAADEATALVPDGPGALAKCLVNLGKELTAAHGWGWIGINGGFRSKLGMRVERLVRMSSGGKRPPGSWIGAMARIAATILILPAVVLLCGALPSARGQKADSWRAEMRASWNNSPGAQLLLAALDDQEKQKPNIATQLRNAKLLYEKGKLNESEAILVQILREDPSNKSAPYFLDLIKEARSTGSSPPSVAFHSSKGRQRILSKLDHMRLNNVHYNDVPLSEVLNQLRRETTIRDPDGVGINFIISPYNDTADAAAVSGRQSVDMSQTPITISPPMSDARLADVLEAITKVAKQPIQYTVENYAVVFSPKPDGEMLPLYSKVFRVDPTTFVQKLNNVYTANGNTGISTVEMVRAFLTAAGVRLTDPGKNVSFAERTGMLYVRATEQDLTIIQQAIEPLNQTPPQLTIETKFVELSEEESRSLGFDFGLHDALTFHGASGFHFHLLPAAGPDSFLALRKIKQTPTPAAVNGIMSDAQFRLAINAMEQRTGADILSALKVTVLSGGQAHISSLDGDQGVTLDVISTVEPSGFAIQTTAIGSIKEDNHALALSASANLWDSQTLVVAGVMTNQNPGARKVLLVLVTLTIIDAAGNRVHTEDEIPRQPIAPNQ